MSSAKQKVPIGIPIYDKATGKRATVTRLTGDTDIVDALADGETDPFYYQRWNVIMEEDGKTVKSAKPETSISAKEPSSIGEQQAADDAEKARKQALKNRKKRAAAKSRKIAYERRQKRASDDRKAKEAKVQAEAEEKEAKDVEAKVGKVSENFNAWTCEELCSVLEHRCGMTKPHVNVFRKAAIRGSCLSSFTPAEFKEQFLKPVGMGDLQLLLDLQEKLLRSEQCNVCLDKFNPKLQMMKFSCGHYICLKCSPHFNEVSDAARLVFDKCPKCVRSIEAKLVPS
jgi:hypothetical protein